ncbi:MAG: hypothetical protein H6575_20250 [Lewinellaceae bacterium]|nr:hypothetical protein [Lewinellaceae bacterium]
MLTYDQFKIFRPFLSKMPEEALATPLHDLLHLLDQAFGQDLYRALDPNVAIASPVAGHRDTEWLKRANTVGINVRTIGHFFNIIPYALTLPPAQNAIHILPIWEPGVVSSLYGPASWNINPEFYSPELAATIRELNTVEKQLRVTVNLLHLLGRSVGMDVVPHTDRFSEMATANPGYFEWLQRRDLTITDHSDEVFRRVQALIFGHLAARGSAVAGLPIPDDADVFFSDLPERERLRILFGEPHDYAGRLKRRKVIVDMLYREGYETVPATMGPPYRGIEVDPDPAALVRDEEGRVWRDYRITKPETFSRVFGPLARYKLYESKDRNRNWELDFSRPHYDTWAYVSERYRRVQAEFGFDFMRGDMSHVQMRPEGVPAERDDYYDLLGAVKKNVLHEKPYFGYFAESFLAPPSEMAYGDECDHLEASFADSTLGDLQSEPVGTDKFAREFAQYRHWLDTRSFAPNFTLMTADKDDPRFDRFYLDGNEIRYFIALFLHDMPSYMGLGFECRDPHPIPAPNEHYTKLYVFQMPHGDKGTSGPYQWGRNRSLYEHLVRQKMLACDIWPEIEHEGVKWLLPPDPEGYDKVIAWTQAGEPKYIFIANLDTKNSQSNIVLTQKGNWQAMFSTHREADRRIAGADSIRLDLLPGEGRVLGFLSDAFSME